MTVAAPAETLGTIGVPKQNRTIHFISVGRVVVWDGAFREAPGISGAHEDSEFVYLSGVAPGRHTMDIRYSALPATTAVPAKPVSYPAKLIAEAPSPEVRRDYGLDGSVRFSAGNAGSDERRLPDYVAEVSHQSSRHGQWALGGRTTGYLMTGNPRATYQTMTVDVRLKEEHLYRMALYFIDGDRQTRRQVVELFDLESKKILAPVEVVDDFDDGKYLVYEYNRSCRIRIDHVRGGDAVVSGIFFDPVPAASKEAALLPDSGPGEVNQP